MQIAVKDANVFIDLEQSGLLELWFKLGIETHTTIFIENELKLGGHREALSHFSNGNVTSHDLSFAEIALIENLTTEVHRAAKFNDCSVLYLAEKLGVPLITGDGALRKSARRRHVEIRGVLWIFDELIEQQLLSPASAAAKLETLLDRGSFLPMDACTERVNRWNSR